MEEVGFLFEEESDEVVDTGDKKNWEKEGEELSEDGLNPVDVVKVFPIPGGVNLFAEEGFVGWNIDLRENCVNQIENGVGEAGKNWKLPGAFEIGIVVDILFNGGGWIFGDREKEFDGMIFGSLFKFGF